MILNQSSRMNDDTLLTPWETVSGYIDEVFMGRGEYLGFVYRDKETTLLIVVTHRRDVTGLWKSGACCKMSGPAVAVRVLSERRFSVTREVEVIGVFGTHEHEYDSLCGSWLGLTRDGRELHMRGQGARLS